MGNSSFESQVGLFDEESKLSFYVESNGSQQSSPQSAKLVLEGYGKSPTFGNRRAPSQKVVKGDLLGKSLAAGHPSSKITDGSQRESVPKSNISQQISAQSAKLFFEGFGESPTFGKRICPSQDVVKENNKRDLHGKSLIADQPSFEKTGHSQKESVPRSNGSQQSSAQSAKLILEGYGKSPPTFEKRICPTQGIVKENSERDIHGKSLVVGQPSSEITGNSQKESVRRSSQDMDVPDFDSKDKMYWFTEHKRQRALCKRLKKQLECKDLRIKLISQQIKVLSDLLNN